MNFLDQQWTDDGQPYGPVRYKEIVQERYYLVKHGNFSYADTGKMTPTERDYVRDFLLAEAKKQQELMASLSNKRKK